MTASRCSRTGTASQPGEHMQPPPSVMGSSTRILKPSVALRMRQGAIVQRQPLCMPSHAPLPAQRHLCVVVVVVVMSACMVQAQTGSQ